MRAGIARRGAKELAAVLQGGKATGSRVRPMTGSARPPSGLRKQNGGHGARAPLPTLVDWVRRVGKGPPPRAAPAIGITQDTMKRLRLLPTLRS